MKKIIVPLLSFISVILIHSKSFSQAGEFNQGELVSKNFIETIPIEFKALKVIVPVEINGKIRKFILDTGAPLVISKELQAELNVAGNKGLIRDINERRDSLEYVMVPSLKIGNVEYKDTKGLVFDMKQGLFGCFQVDGFIGSNLLRNTIVQINVKDKLLKLTDNIKSLKSNFSGGFKMKLNEQSTPIIEVYLNGEMKEELVFDSGADGFYSLCMRNFNFFAEKGNLMEYVIDSGRGATVSGTFGLENDTLKYKIKLKNLKIDKMYFENLIVDTEIANNSRMGAKLLEYAIVTIDYPGNQFYVDPFVKGKNKVDVYRPDFGFELKPENGIIKTGLVWEKSEAYLKGIRSNFILKKIDDFVLAEKTLCELFFGLSELSDQKEAALLLFTDTAGNEKSFYIKKK